MGWKYNAGLGLIGTVVFIWVASAEITQVAGIASFLGAVYMRVFLKESVRYSDGITLPILKRGSNVIQNDDDHSQRTIPIFKNILCWGYYLLAKKQEQCKVLGLAAATGRRATY